jgi:hypothetical protein
MPSRIYLAHSALHRPIGVTAEAQGLFIASVLKAGTSPCAIFQALKITSSYAGIRVKGL